MQTSGLRTNASANKRFRANGISHRDSGSAPHRGNDTPGEGKSFFMCTSTRSGDGILYGIRYIVQADPAKLSVINAWNAPAPEVPWPRVIMGMFFNNLYLVVYESVVGAARTRGARDLRRVLAARRRGMIHSLAHTTFLSLFAH